MNLTTDELSTWCLECGATVDVIVPGWTKCPRCGWEEFRAGMSRAADLEIRRRRQEEARECYEEETLKIPLVRKRGGGKKSGRRRHKDGKGWWRPWYVRGMGMT